MGAQSRVTKGYTDEERERSWHGHREMQPNTLHSQHRDT